MRFVINSYFEARLQLHQQTEDEDFTLTWLPSIAYTSSVTIEQDLVDEKNLI